MIPAPIHENPEEMARWLVQHKSSALDVHRAVKGTFGRSPSVRAIASLRGHFLRQHNRTGELSEKDKQARRMALRRHRLRGMIQAARMKVVHLEREAERLGVAL